MASRALSLVLLAGALGAVGAAGCGDDADGGSAATTTTSAEDRQLAFTRCLREHGIDVRDPSSSGGGPTRIRMRAGKGGQTPRSLDRAMTTCREKTGGGPPELTPEQREEFQDQALAFARCMRQHGVDVPDPQVAGEGGVLIRRREGRGRLPSLDSPAFQRAQEACEDLMPRPPGAREEGR
ncbi:hypothetical protein [Conexibacter sp. SYSU D00693]|uniref:hypothetical protein n=1 Tax=Conexibacter sp. SYSU D00693 TaxID=2812560 RepID=UPI00196B29E5|nr:hypothetical protein [Conexibacter sp. SYSU D00693]